MTVRCPSLDENGRFPVRFARAGQPGALNVSPAVEWSDPPDGTASFALTIIDRHPIARNWVHWCVVDIPQEVRRIVEGASGRAMPRGSSETENTFGEPGYGGPQPPRGTGQHEYHLTIHALRCSSLAAEGSVNPDRVFPAIRSAEIGQATVVGFFESR